MLALALAGCSFTTFDQVACEVPADCRTPFGFGHTCGGDGYCREIRSFDRCDRAYPADLLTHPEDYRDAVIFGTVFDSAYDRLDEQAAQLAVMAVNGEGGLDGAEYAVVQCDDNADGSTTYDTDDETTVVERIGDWLRDEVQVEGLVGPSTSSAAQAMYPSTAGEGMLMVSPSASSPELTLLDGSSPTDQRPGLLWRTVPSDATQADAIAYDMGRRGVAKVAVVAVTGPNGDGLTSAFLAAYADGSRVVDSYAYDETNVSLLGEHLTSVANGGYDEVLYVGSSVGSVAKFLNGAATFPAFESGSIGIFLTDAARYEDLFATTPGAATLYPSVRGTSPAAPSGTVYDAFRSAYASAFQGDSADGSIYAAYAYDASWLLIYGTAWSQAQDGAITGRGMARGLRQVSSGQPIDVQATSWSPVRASFAEGASVDLRGASGPLDFDPVTEETSNPVDLWQIVDDPVDGYVFVNVDQYGA